ncbi:MAG TPA: hypothetical protein VHI13_01265 [Candidatus Kapabacteria bacterium]|nr:hypothetical protein [Candidatus Kapabacteria bacterium]
MGKTIWQALAATTAILFFATTAQAQIETDGAYLGPHIGLGAYGNGISLGGDGEYILTKPGEAGPGRIGIGGTVDYWSWSSASGGNDYYWTYSWVPIGVYGAYHFVLSDKKWDLFAGLGIGYIIVNATWHKPNGGLAETDYPAYSSGAYWSAVAGLRYFLSPGLALHARLGLGASVLSAGINVRL